MGPNRCHPCGAFAVLSLSPPDLEGSQKAPQESHDDGSEAFPKFGQIVDDLKACFNSENYYKNEPEIVKTHTQIIAQMYN